MSHRTTTLKGLYVITDDKLTPHETIITQVTQALEGGASLIQLRNKSENESEIKTLAIAIQALCRDHKALFVLNDKIQLAIELGVDGLHIGKSDHATFRQIRRDFSGIIGVSCYGDVDLAFAMQESGADYVAFGSFFASPTKPDSNIVPLSVLSEAKKKLQIPVCAIGGINLQNITQVMYHKPDMVSLISDIWNAEDIRKQCETYKNIIYN